MKVLRVILSSGLILAFILIYSCNKDNNEFGAADTFNLDSLIVTPSTQIGDEFAVSWAVTTTGFPTYFVDVYLSNDSQLDAGDLMISTGGSVDAEEEASKIDDTHYFQIDPVTGSNQVTFLYNTTTSDPGDSGCKSSDEVNDPSGAARYLIARFYNSPGIQIQFGRNQMAVQVTFQ
jgi:hypothetical protein